MGERVCAARKQASDARELLERLLESCVRLRSMAPEHRARRLLDVEEDLHEAIVQAAKVVRGLGRVQW